MRLFAAFLLVVSPGFAEAVFACQCHLLSSVVSSYERASVVFVGKAVSTNDEENSDRFYSEKEIVYEFEVEEKFKGIKNNKAKINLGKKYMCFFGFEIGKSYLVYAYGDDEQSLHTYRFCNRTEEIEEAQDQIYFIREKLAGKPEPQFYGSVVVRKKNGENWRTEYLAGFKFVIERKNKKIEIVTDKNGRFQIYNLSEGTYNVNLSSLEKYQIDYLELEGFEVVASKVSIPMADEHKWLLKSINKRNIENFLKSHRELSRGVYLEIILRVKQS